MRHKTLDVRR